MQEGEHATATAPGRSLPRQTGPYPVPRVRTGRSGWAPLPQASNYPRSNPYLAREVDAIVDALRASGPLSSVELSRRLGARFWGPGRLREAMRSGLASGRIRRVARDRYAAAIRDTPSRASGRGDSARNDGAAPRDGVDGGNEIVDKESAESFPASDPPSFWSGVDQREPAR